MSERVELKDVGISSTRRKKKFFEKTKSNDLQVPTTLFPCSFEVLAKREKCLSNGQLSKNVLSIKKRLDFSLKLL